MNKSALSKWFAAALLSFGMVSPVYADSPTTGPGTPEQQHYSVSGFISHEELGKRLEQIERNSQGKVNVEVAGYSNQGREIYKATVGNGEKIVMIQSEIHGNEKNRNSCAASYFAISWFEQ